MPCFDLQQCNKNERKQRETTLRLGRKVGLSCIGCLREIHSNSGQWQAKSKKVEMLYHSCETRARTAIRGLQMEFY